MDIIRRCCCGSMLNESEEVCTDCELEKEIREFERQQEM